jgi:hypothetical protein
MTMALKGLVAFGPAEEAAAARAALTAAPWEAARFLLARSYLGDTVGAADEAIGWLCSTREHLALGYVDSVHWASRDVVAAATPHCSEQALESLVKVLLAYVPDWERTPDRRRQRGLAQLVLVNAIAPARRSREVEQRLGELRRKFGVNDVERPRGVTGGAVGSPIPPGRAPRMNDEQWLGAMRKYDLWLGTAVAADGSLSGGALQLSQLLETETRKDPTRFAQLLLRMDAQIAETYPSAVLRGLADAELDVPTLSATVARAVSLATSETNRWMVRLVERQAALDLDDTVLDAVVRVATGDPDPADDLWRVSPSNSTAYFGGDIDGAGLNCCRGAAVLALRALIATRPQRLDKLRSALTSAAADPVIAVRACCVGALRIVVSTDPSFATATFAEAVGGDDDVLRSGEVHRFLYTALRDHYDSVAPTVARMLRSADGEIARAGARVMTVASYFSPDLDQDVDACLKGDVSHRLGAVEVYAQSLANESRRDRCMKSLSDAFDDEDEAVRTEAGRSFWQLENGPIDRYWALFEALARSRAFPDAAGAAIRALARSPGRLPEGALALCRQLTETHAAAMADVSTTAAGDTEDVIQVTLRLRAQAAAAGDLRACLDVVDLLVKNGALGVDDALGDLER